MLLSLCLMLEPEICRADSKESKMDVQWARTRTRQKSQAQAGTSEDTLEAMSVLFVTDFDGLGVPQKPGAVCHGIKHRYLAQESEMLKEERGREEPLWPPNPIQESLKWSTLMENIQERPFWEM